MAGSIMGKAGMNAQRMNACRHTARVAPVALLLALAISPHTSLEAATPIRFAGAVGGLVTNSSGKPQQGATVALFNQQERLLQRVYTDISGNFAFADLLPDLYSIQVSLTSFVPATRDRVAVRPGMRSLLEVSLSRMFSSIQVVSTVPAPGGLMNDDWKWTLRADSSLRPILRLLPADIARASGTIAGGTRTAVFHDSSAVVKISASDGAQTQAATGEADLGTQFAFATSLYASNQVAVSGNLGYAPGGGAPAAAIRTTFSREIAGDRPTISVTMRQMNVSSRAGQSMLGGPSGDGPLPTLRTLSISLSDKAQLLDALSLEYGSELDTISFLDRLQYFSPWAKLSYALPHGHADLVFTSGNARPGLDAGDSRSADASSGLQTELATLALLPRLSQRDGHVRVQRGDDYEIGYSETVGNTEYRVSGYHQYVANTTLTIANPEAGLFTGDLLPSMFASSALFNAGNVSTSGYTVSATRSLSPNYKLTAAYGIVGVMTPRSDTGITDAEGLRRMMTTAHRRALTLRAAGTVKQTGTRFVTSYQYSDLRASLPVASFSTQPDRAEPGLNIALRQPIPFIPGMAGRVEATAEMRNLLAQGYLPLQMADGRQLLIVNTPRVFRGGLAFVF